jgi:octaprenyl-diphosphate synthase
MKFALSTTTAELEPAAQTPLELRDAGGLPAGVDLLARLEGIVARQGLEGLADRLADLAAFVGHDLTTFEDEFGRLPRDARLVGQSAWHLLDLGGKRLRPTLVALAARAGSGFDHKALDLAVAAELVHTATLLHDDVVDVGDARRGVPSARTVYGNAASIFAGDWLLVEALRRIERSALPGLLVEALDTIERMIFAESVQLEWRGRITTDREHYFEVVEGKTASLFRWAMRAGALAGGLPEEQRDALGDYGRHLGVAFQAVDDLLDLTGETARTGKEVFADLREGKLTFPVIVALERDPSLRPVIEEILAAGSEEATAFQSRHLERVTAKMVDALRETRASRDCLELARERSAKAVACLQALPDHRARRALATVAEAIVNRDL